MQNMKIKRFRAAQYRYENQCPYGEDPFETECPCCDEAHEPETTTDYDGDGGYDLSFEAYCPACVANDCESNHGSYCCKTCNKTFLKVYNVKDHLIVHTTHQPFKCSLCGRSFNQHNNLKRHLRNNICKNKPGVFKDSKVDSDWF